MKHRRFVISSLLFATAALPAGAQVVPIVTMPTAAQQVQPGSGNPAGSAAQNAAATTVNQVIPQFTPVRPNYMLAANDQVLIRVPAVEEINEKPFRVGADGSISLPLLGSVPAAGMTIEQFEAALTTGLKTYVKDPKVTVTLVQFHSDPIFVMGAFQRPGIYALQSGQTNLLELLSTVGGLQSNTTRRIKITRRLEQGRIPLPNTIDDPDSKTSSVEISLNRLMESPNPAENILLQPYDVLNASRAEMVFVSGEVGKVGGYPLDDRESLSVIQLLTLAGGLAKGADGSKARILRPILDTSRRAEIPLNVDKIMAGKANDYPLMANDILIVPRGKSAKSVMLRPVVTLVPALVTSLIWVALR